MDVIALANELGLITDPEQLRHSLCALRDPAGQMNKQKLARAFRRAFNIRKEGSVHQAILGLNYCEVALEVNARNKNCASWLGYWRVRHSILTEEPLTLITCHAHPTSHIEPQMMVTYLDGALFACRPGTLEEAYIGLELAEAQKKAGLLVNEGQRKKYQDLLIGA